MSQLAHDLAASVLLIEARKKLEFSNAVLEEVTAALKGALAENELLKAQLDLANSKLIKTRRFDVVDLDNVSFLLRPQAG
jgi:hypothetical protein